MTRTRALLILIPLALGVGLLLLLPLFLDKDKILELAAAALQEKTGATLTVAGESRLSVFPGLGVTLGDASLEMAGEEQASLQVRSLDIGLRLLPLLSGRADIDSVALDGLTVKIASGQKAPTINTAGLSDEELDALYDSRRRAAAEAGEAAGAETILALPLALNVQHLSVTDSRIEQLDTATQETTVIELTTLEATGLNLDGNPIALDVKVTLAGEKPVKLSIGGSLRVDQQNQKVILDKIDAQISGATAEPIGLQILGDVDLSRQVADLKLNLATGETRGDGALRYARFESPQIDTRLKLNLFNPALLALAGPGVAARSGDGKAAASGDEPLPLDAIRAIDTRAELAIDKAVFDAHTVSDLRTSLRIVDGVVELSSLTGILHGGKLDMRATFDGKHNTATLDTSGQLAQLDIASAWAATGAKPLLTGNASLDWTLAGKGRSRNELVAALTGPIKLTTQEVVLGEVSVEHLLCQAVALTNQEQLTASFPTSTTFTTLGADIQLAGGKAQLAPLRAGLPGITLTGRGKLDLLSRDFRATFKARLSPELENLDRACRVSKRLTAIDWPVECKGNTNGEPASWCSVDTAEIIEDLTKNEAQRKLKKEAGKLLDKLFRN
ncbi:MAG: AsmA family protein [Halieaceae bacterium]|jgi:uncharacterized protein involved in outer membrane biogenesis|nr:AsmA family protein [Halieaceae bacterium]